MNIYMTQPVRKKHDISWEEEYLLGLVDHKEIVRVMDVLHTAREVMTNATTHKYLTQLINRKLLKHVPTEDKRVKKVELTSAGAKYLNEVSNDTVSVS